MMQYKFPLGAMVTKSGGSTKPKSKPKPKPTIDITDWRRRSGSSWSKNPTKKPEEPQVDPKVEDETAPPEDADTDPKVEDETTTTNNDGGSSSGGAVYDPNAGVDVDVPPPEDFILTNELELPTVVAPVAAKSGNSTLVIVAGLGLLAYLVLKK